MHKYDEREELASRDIVYRFIDNELKKNGKPHVYLDCRHIEIEKFIAHFPVITQKCASLGIDISKDLIPVLPALHYFCGGVNVTKNAKTSIKNLLAVGEVTRTGLHGGNRLASNSLLEGIVYAHTAFKDVSKKYVSRKMPTNIPLWNDTSVMKSMEKY